MEGEARGDVAPRLRPASGHRVGGLSMDLEQALQIVKAAGYRVSKPARKEKPEKGPTCITTFADGQVVRMSVASLDAQRATRIAAYAWQSRAMQHLGRELAWLKSRE